MKAWEEQLKNIMLQRTGIDFSEKVHLQEENFFGIKINLPVRELLLILFDIERIINVHILDEKIISGEFNSYANVKECLRASLEQSTS